MKNKNVPQELFEEFNLRFDSYSDEEMVKAFNGQVGNQGSGTAKMSFLRAIRSQMIKRKIDFSEIGDEKSMSYANKVVLKGKKLHTIDD